MNIKSLLEKEIPFSALVLGVSLVLTGVLVGFSLVKMGQKSDQIVSTGSARKSVDADLAKVSGEISVRVPASQLQSGYEKIAKDKELVLAYMKNEGALDSDISSGSPYASEVWSNNPGPREFDIKQTITVQSKNLEIVKKISDNSLKVMRQGALYQPYAVEYYYTNLPELRRALLGEAVKDAKARATEIAKSSGDKVGGLKSARAGVVQVLAPNSQNVEDYGTYDTSTIKKDVVVSVNATFSLK